MPTPVTRLELEKSLRTIAESIQDGIDSKFGRQVGFTLFLFDFGDSGNLAYVSNAQRMDMIRAVEEWLAIQRAEVPAVDGVSAEYRFASVLVATAKEAWLASQADARMDGLHHDDDEERFTLWWNAKVAAVSANKEG